MPGSVAAEHTKIHFLFCSDIQIEIVSCEVFDYKHLFMYELQIMCSFTSHQIDDV